MPFLIIVLIVLIVAIIYTSSQNRKQLEANIERKKNFVTAFLPNARIIVNNGKHLFFMDDEKQVFGIDDSGNTYSYIGLRSINIYNDAINFSHNNASYQGLKIGKGVFSDDKSAPLDANSIAMIANEMVPILRNNLHEKLTRCGITPTHEYINRGEIWGCDINSKYFYNTHAYIQIHDFSKLLKVTMQDVSNNSNWRSNYIITVTIKGRDGWDDDEFEVYVDDQKTLNNLLAMFKGIKDRQNNYSYANEQKSFDMMEGHDFEYFCADLIKYSGFYNVSVTKGSGDQGVDILAEKDGIKYAIQCKNYSSHLGNTSIQEVNAGKTFYNCHVGVVMTNSYFTQGAKELAKATGVILWDRTVLERMIKDKNEY